MNRHFEDSRYYLGRTVETAVAGLKAELEPVLERIRELTGREVEAEPEPDRLERLQGRAKELEARAETEARKTMVGVRERVRSNR